MKNCLITVAHRLIPPKWDRLYIPTFSSVCGAYSYIWRFGGIGRHKGLKIPRGVPRMSSTLIIATNIENLNRFCREGVAHSLPLLEFYIGGGGVTIRLCY